MPLTVLSDPDVRTVLHSLTTDDIRDLQLSLADALHHYSTSTEEDDNACCSSYQPMRTSLKRNDGQTSLFMPASSSDGLGVKIVTLTVPDSNPQAASTPSSSKAHRSSSDSTTLSSFDSLSISANSDTPLTSLSSESTSAKSTTPKGCLTLLDKTGTPRAFINAEEITAFRTALASTMLFNKRTNVHDVVVFGAGKQAYWHIRLALLLRGPEIKHLTIINRSFATAGNLVQQLYAPETEDDGPTSTPAVPLARPKIQIITPSAVEYDRLLKATIRGSSVIFFTTPSLVPLFPAPYLTNPEGRKKGRYLAAIGSYKPHMVEIHPDILRQNVAPEHGRHHHKHARQGGAVIVDSVEACLREAGEVIQAGLGGRELVEIGELIMLRKDAEKQRAEAKRNGEHDQLDTGGVELGEVKKKWWGSKKTAHDKEKEEKEESSLLEWLQKGNVIYKSVGLGLMDVVVGSDLVRIADERGIGTRIEDF